MAKILRKGDDVEWQTSQGKTRGKVVERQTSPTHVKGHKVAASQDDPRYIVESGTSGKRAAHKPGALKKR